MSKTIHIFYNGFDYFVPPDNRWPDFQNSTSPRMFLQCAASWIAQGWTVKRLSTERFTFQTPGFQFTGRLVQSLKYYPLQYWNLWHVLKRFNEPVWVCNMDIFNQCFTNPNPIENKELFGATSLHVNGWSASIMHVTPSFVHNAIVMIERYDAGKTPPIESEFVIDDFIIKRDLAYTQHTLCEFAFIKQGWQAAPLVHFARSTITRCLNEIPIII